MILRKFDHFNPETVDEALSFLREYRAEAKLIAGGVDLINSLKQELILPKALINLKTISGLNEIKEDGKRGVRIGALVTLYELKTNPLILKRYPMFSQAVDKIAVVPIQNMATLGGNLCMDTRCLYYNQSFFWRKGKPRCFKLGGRICNAMPGSDHCHAVYQGDTAPILMALGAIVKIVGGGKDRKFPLKDFFTGKGEKPNILNPPEILTEIEIPAPSSDLICGYEKFSIRSAIDYPLAGVAVAVSSDRAKVVLNGVHSSPIEVEENLLFLRKERLDQPVLSRLIKAAVDMAHPVPNTDSSPSHRKKMLGVLLKRLLERGNR